MQEEIRTEVISWLKTIVFAVVFALIINNFVIVNAKVPTGSMEDNIMPKDRIVAFRPAYLTKGPERFDIVVFRFPDEETTLYVKRVIGLPNETVEVRDGKVYIDNATEPLEDSFTKEKPTGGDGRDGIFHVPEGKYFMMGDNRNTSNDSRFWENKYVDKSKILGKVIFKYFKGFKIYKNNV